MNKVENISINGVVFYLGGDAYEVLKKYLENLKKYFSSQPDGLEIISDIEARIAELFSERTKGAPVVISLEEVQEVVHTLGTPEDIASFDGLGSDAPGDEMGTPPALPRISRKLYRDADRRILGGVCAGLAILWSVPVWLVRLIWLLLFFLPFPFILNFGSYKLVLEGYMILLYVIMWMVIPKADTPARKLSMMGMPVNVDGLRSLREKVPVGQQQVYRTFSRARSVLPGVFAKIFGVLFVCSAVLMAIGALVLVLFQSFWLQYEWNWLYYPVSSLLCDMFGASSYLIWKIMVMLTLLIPVILLFSSGVSLLSRKFHLKPYVWISLLSIWVLVLLSGGMFTALKVSEYSFTQPTQEPLMMHQQGDTVMLRASIALPLANIFGAYYNEKDDMYMGRPRIFLGTSTSQEWEVEVTKSASGDSPMIAAERAEHIEWVVRQEPGLLLVNPYFSVGEGSQWALQQVGLVVNVPEGKTLILDASVEDLMVHDWRFHGRSLLVITNVNGKLAFARP